MPIKLPEKQQPNGKDLLEFLLALYAEQEGVKITYELESSK